MKTRIRTIPFYDRFVCRGADCPVSCCNGWRIPVDEESVRNYKREKGLLGIRARLFLSGRQQFFFNRFSLRCPMLDPDGLCALQKKRGEKFLPEVCRVYPREWANLGTFVERMLDLSCVHAAQLFLEAGSDDDSLVFREETGLWTMPRAGDNDDPAFLMQLDAVRAGMMERLSLLPEDSPEAFDTLLYHFSEETARMQAEVLHTGVQGMRRIRLFPFSIMLMNELMSTSFFEDHLRYTAPKLYKACRRYYKVFDPLTEIQGQEKLDAMTAAMLSGKGQVGLGNCIRYFSYCLLRAWFDTYEDYSFVRRIVEAAIHLNIVFLLEALAQDAGIALTVEERAKIISIYEKRVWHNSEILGEMVKQVNARFVPEPASFDAQTES